MRHKKKAFISLSLLIWLISVRFVAACQPPEPDWWFVETINIDQSERPIGVKISTLNETGQRVNERSEITIVNHTGTIMYGLAHTLPPNANTEQSLFDTPVDGFPIDAIRASQFVSYDAVMFQYLAPGFVDHNVREPGRPPDIDVPNPQQSQIQVLFGEKVLTFPIELTYELNTNYNPRNGTGGCGLANFIITPFIFINNAFEWMGSNLIVFLSAILILMTSIILIWKQKNRKINFHEDS